MYRQLVAKISNTADWFSFWKTRFRGRWTKLDIVYFLPKFIFIRLDSFIKYHRYFLRYFIFKQSTEIERIHVLKSRRNGIVVQLQAELHRELSARVSRNCKNMQMTRPKGVKSKRVNRAHARTGTRSCTGSYHDYVTHKHRSGTREEGLVFVWCEETRERRLSLLNVNVFVSQPRYCISRNGSHWRNLEGSFPFHVSRPVSEYEEYISYGIKKRKNYLVTYVDRISDWYFWQNSFHKFTYESSFAWETFSFALQLYLLTCVLFSKQFSS